MEEIHLQVQITFKLLMFTELKKKPTEKKQYEKNKTKGEEENRKDAAAYFQLFFFRDCVRLAIAHCEIFK